MREPNCSECPLNGTHERVQGDGPLDAEVLVLVEAPGANEVEAGRPLVGWTGTFVNETLAFYGFPRNKVRVENVFEHKAQYSSRQGKAAANCCGPSVWTIIRAMPNLRTVIAFGEAALREASGYRAWETMARDYKAASKAYLKASKAAAKEKDAYEKRLTKWENATAKKRGAQWAKVAAYNDAKEKALAAGKQFKRKPPKDPIYPKIPERKVIDVPLKPIEPTPFGIKGIGVQRGSPLWVYGYEGKIRLFPVIHPAACAPKRQPRLRPLIMVDIRRATEFHKGARVAVEPEITAIYTAKQLREWVTWNLLTRRVGLDIEWSRKYNELVSIGIGNNRVGVIVFYSEHYQMPPADRAECFEILQGAFNNPNMDWGGHFVAGYDEYKLSTVGLKVRMKWDSLYSFHILHPDLGSSRDEESDELQKRKLGNSSVGSYGLGFVMSVLGNLPYHKDMLDRDAAELPLDDLVRYNGLDVFGCWDAQRVMDKTALVTMPEGVFQAELLEEMELARIATRMSRRGVSVNEPERILRLQDYIAKQEDVRRKAQAIGGSSGFNIGSSTQIAKYLEGLGIKVKRNKDTGKPVLNGNEIRKLVAKNPEDPLLTLIQEYRTLEKEITAYDGLIPGHDGRVHTSFKVHGTVGTRWSSAGPNLQNLTYKQREILGGHYERDQGSQEGAPTYAEADEENPLEDEISEG